MSKPNPRRIVPVGFAESVMKKRVEGVHFADMVDDLENEYKDHIAVLAQRKRALDLSDEGIRGAMKRGMSEIEKSNPQLLATYKSMYEKYNDKRPPGAAKFVLEMWGDSVPEDEWEERLKKKFPKHNGTKESFATHLLKEAARLVPRKGNEQLWARRDKVVEESKKRNGLANAGSEGTMAYRKRYREETVARRMAGEDASQKAVRDHLLAERDADGVKDLPCGQKRRNSDPDTRQRYNKGQAEWARRDRKKRKLAGPILKDKSLKDLDATEDEKTEDDELNADEI